MKTPTSQIRRMHRFFFALPVLSGLIAYTFAAASDAANDKNTAPEKVAILVARVGNTQAFAPMTDISLKTDYSIRSPRMGTDVFIDHQERLAESVPSYPKYSGYTTGYEVEYFKNISPEIFAALKKAFEQKSYEVFDLKSLAESWDKPYYELTVKDILAALGNTVDYLFIYHYMDIGNSSIDSRAYKVKAVNSGFTSAVFTYALFKTDKLKRMFSYSPTIGFGVTPSIIYNPAIMEDPESRKRVTVDCGNSASEETFKIKHDFTDDELVGLLTDNVLNGFQCSGKKYIDCYDECRFYDTKGLIPRIP